MTTNLPLPPFPDAADHGRLIADDELAQAAKLERCRERHEQGPRVGLWTGSREGVINTVIAITASLVFGGAAGVWFDQADWFVRSLVIAGGTMFMAALVCLAGSLLCGRNPIFWGIGMQFFEVVGCKSHLLNKVVKVWPKHLSGVNLGPRGGNHLRGHI